MSLEIEAKMRLTDRADVERRLEEAGAERGPRIVEHNTYFDTDDHRLKSSDQGLRIRVEHRDDDPQRSTLTHKGPRAHGRLKSRTETEVDVDDARAAAELLTALGYSPQLTFEKCRQRWFLDDCTIDLDTLPCIGEFIEIEGPSDDAVMQVRRRLGLADAPMIRASYIAMLISYQREHHLREKTLKIGDH